MARSELIQQMKIASFIFSPQLIPTLFLLILVPLFISLGMWQLDRAAEKNEIMSNFELDSKGQATAIEEFQGQKSEFEKVILNGSYETKRQFLIDNRIYQGRAGYEILTPFKLTSNGQYVLVNRGWVSLGYSRQSLPDISMNLNEPTSMVEGLLTYPSKGVTLGEAINSTTGQWPILIQYLDYPVLAKVLNGHLIQGVVQLGSSEDAAYPKIWKPISFGPEKHYAYALQWFAFAFVLLVLYIVLNFKKVKEK